MKISKAVSNKKIKNIIFDLGGVILQHRNDIMEEFVSKLCTISFEQASEFWQASKAELIKGKISSREFLSKLRNDFDIKTPLDKLCFMWIDFYKKEAQGVNWDVLELADKLRKKYKVYLFTDTIDVHNDFNRTRNIYNKFDKVFISFKEGTIKTEKKAFLNVLKKIGAKSNECLYIDDLEKNVKVAESVGMKTVIFKTPGQLKEFILLTL